MKRKDLSQTKIIKEKESKKPSEEEHIELEDIDQIDSDLEEFKDEGESKPTRIRKPRKKITELETTIATLKTQLDEMYAKVEKLQVQPQTSQSSILSMLPPELDDDLVEYIRNQDPSKHAGHRNIINVVKKQSNSALVLHTLFFLRKYLSEKK